MTLCCSPPHLTCVGAAFFVADGHGSRVAWHATSDMRAAPGRPDRRQDRVKHAICALEESLGYGASPHRAACRRVRRRPRHPCGDAGLAHPIGFVVQFAGLVPSSRRWSLNRLATLMGGGAPCWLMLSAKPSALAAHRVSLGRVRATWLVTTTR